MDLIDIFRAFHPKTAEYTNVSSVHGTFPRIDMLRQKISINKFKKIKIISSIFSDHNAMKLEINHKNTGKYTNTWKLINMLLNKEWASKKLKEEIKRYLEINENENNNNPKHV